MQILPLLSEYDAQTGLEAVTDRAREQYPEGESFARALDTTRRQMQDDARDMADDAERAARAAMQRRGRNEKSEDGAPPIKAKEAFQRVEEAGEEVDAKGLKMTRDDFAEVKQALKKYGLTEDEIATLEDKVVSKEGLSWGELVAALMTRGAEGAVLEGPALPKLGDEDKKQLQAFFLELGFTQKQSEQLVKDIESGDFKDVLQAVRKQLENVSPDRLVDLSPKGIEALGKALSLSEETVSKLKQLLTDTGREEFSPAEIKNALGLIQKALAAKGDDGKDKLNELRQSLAAVLSKAVERKRGGDEDSAKVVAASKDKTVVDEFLGRDKATEAARVQNGGEDDNERRADNKDARDGKESARDGSDKKGASQLARQAAEAAADKGGEQAETPNDEGDEWTRFWEKVASRDQGADEAALVRSIESKAGDAARNVSAKVQDKAALARQHQESIFRQVKDGVMKTLENGGRQLTLQLEPESLGTVQVMLQVKGKEIAATIRTENADVSKLVAENLAQVRETLHQQGLKVSELDVQTGLARQGQEQNWSGTEQHNMEQQREAMAQMRTRMRSLRIEARQAAQAAEQAINDVRRSLNAGTVSIIA